jgi:hypothetical protein
MIVRGHKVQYMGKETFGVELIERADEELRPLIGNFACTVQINADEGKCAVRFLNRSVWIGWPSKSVLAARDASVVLELLTKHLRSSVMEVVAGLSRAELIMLKYLTGNLPSDVTVVAIPDQRGRRKSTLWLLENGLVIELSKAQVRDGFIEWGYGENRLLVTETQREANGVLPQ